ncbi:UPF0676 protein C1494.01 [Folsomia candida]|uniref:Feruloyl CoA ortho-hydroxylase 1 n=1 Tax=Folsomia candida TaxID=158441 RepID=A0A226DMU4_FOLCA|nr:UPF0676 protein C1494.01 [Folsomia candida]OXA46533.1 Feruloyl CoA ortho-hydroxylase 1 [Folsomia candida]
MVGTMDYEIPVLDLSFVSGKYDDLPDNVFEKLAQEFGTAMNGVGFAYVTNHGVDMKKIDHIHKLSHEFYSLPTATKQKYRKTDPPECFHGYAGPGDELLNYQEKNSTELREFFDVWGFQQYDAKEYPSEIPEYKAAFDAVRPECNNLGKKLLRAMGKYLKLKDEQFFVKTHSFMDDPTIRTQAQFRTLHYYQMDPSDPNIPTNAIRCGEHADWGTITLLFQDMVGGLEVKRLDGSWIEAVPIKDSILINVGQLLELWSAGIFQATVHRVRILDEERVRKLARQSFIYFINPDGDQVVQPIVPCPPGDEKFLKVTPKVAYDHYKHLIADATKHY